MIQQTVTTERAPVRSSVLAALLLLLTTSAAAQVGRSGLQVTAVDEEGEPLARVELTLSPAADTTARPQIVKTDKRGRFSSRFLTSGRYVIGVKNTDEFFLKQAKVEIMDASGILLLEYDIVAHPFEGLESIPIQGGQVTSIRLVLTDAAYGARLRRQVESGEVQDEVHELVSLYNAKEFEKVASLGERLMNKTSTELPEVLQLTAMSYAHLDRREDAESLLRRAIEIAPDEAELKANLGTLLLEAARDKQKTGGDAAPEFAEAEEWIRQAIAGMEPIPVALLVNHSIALEGAGHPEDAIAVMERIIAEDPANLTIQFRMAALLRRLGKPERAMELLSSLPDTAGDPRAVDILFNIALTFYNEGDYESAQAALARAESIDPNHGNVQRLIGRTYYAQGEPKKAIPYLQRFIELEPDHPEVELEREMVRYLQQADKK